MRAAGWILLLFFVGVGPHVLGNIASRITSDLMLGSSEFASTAHAYVRATYGPLYTWLSFPLTTAVTLAYMWPPISWELGGRRSPPDARVRRRLVAAPLMLALISFVPWICGILFFITATTLEFGRWSTDLMSQQVLSPLMSGFLASTTSYLGVEWLLRTRVGPIAFPDGHIGDMAGTFSLGVRARLLVLMTAVGFVPMFTMLGLVAAANDRAAGGVAMAEMAPKLVAAVGTTFLLYLVLGIVYTLLLARSLTRPLGVMAEAVRRVERGDLDVRVELESNDEVGVLGAGVNAMVDTLREREHILATFGRVVEPDVRDHLLSADLESGGEAKTVTVLFADLRGFTALAEGTDAAEVVATLNNFFSVMAAWVHECGGFVDKFIGDAMLVVFGLFGDTSDAAIDAAAADALRCADGMRERLVELNGQRAADGRDTLEIGIGAATGTVLAGIIGAADRHEYTVIGDTVNVAARLQELCKQEGCDTLVTAETYDHAHRAGTDARLVAGAPLAVRGRTEPVQIYTSSRP